MKSNLISKSETAGLVRAVSGEWGVELPRVRNLRVHELDGARLITGDGVGILETGGERVPFLTETAVLERFPRVTVDMGAVKFVCKGANVMRPGIREFTGFEGGALVCVAEETHGKFLAVGRSTAPSAELESAGRGEAVRTIHYVSDRFWEAAKGIQR